MKITTNTWGEWAIAMHGRYESPILFILFTYCKGNPVMLRKSLSLAGGNPKRILSGKPC
jgi:hypothetical protein